MIHSNGVGQMTNFFTVRHVLEYLLETRLRFHL